MTRQITISRRKVPTPIQNWVLLMARVADDDDTRQPRILERGLAHGPALGLVGGEAVLAGQRAQVTSPDGPDVVGQGLSLFKAAHGCCALPQGATAGGRCGGHRASREDENLRQACRCSANSETTGRPPSVSRPLQAGA